MLRRHSLRRRHARRRCHALVLALAFALALGVTACSDSGTADTSTTTTAAGDDQAQPDAVHQRSVVFAAGQDGIDTYRIPGSAVTADGTVVVVAEARTRSPLDTDPHHLVAKRSTDGGNTWGDLIQVAPQDEPEAGCFPSDPVVTAPTTGDGAGDVVVVFHPCRDGGGLHLTHSSDDGRTWSEMEPLDLAPVDGLAAADIDRLRSGPGHGIQLTGGPAKGRLVMAADTGLSGDTTTVALLLSDDGGASWRVGAHASAPDSATIAPDESAVVELPDGRLLVSSRNTAEGSTNRVQMSVSPDGEEVLTGPDGSPFTLTGDLGLPGVEGSLLALPDQDRVVMSSPSDPTTRRGLRLWTSVDGTSWQPGPLPVPGPAAYSDLVLVDDTTIGVVAEVGDRHPYERIDFIPVRADSLDETAELTPSDADPADAAAGRLMVDGERYAVTRFCLIDDEITLDGGRIGIDLTNGLDAIGVQVDIAAVDDRAPLKLQGVVAVDVSAGIAFKGTLDDPEGTPHDVDLVIVNSLPCG